MRATPIPAPIGIFAHRRPEHLRRVIRSLRDCHLFQDSPLYAFVDGPRSTNEARQVAAVRDIVSSCLGNHCTALYSDKNKGLARSIVSGVNLMCKEHGRAIVIEDDLIVSPDFLSYMNAALDKFAQEESVMQISGHAFDVPRLRERPSAMFLPIITSWGWATWDRAWAHYDDDTSRWTSLLDDGAFRRQFDLDGAYEYSRLLRKQMAGSIDSWAICWYWSVFRRNAVALFPPKSLVQNIGFDGSGTHGWRSAMRSTAVDDTRFAFALPDTPVVDVEALGLLKDYFQARKVGFGAKSVRTAASWLTRLITRAN